VVLALHNYHDTHGRYPPAVVYGEDDQPLYSWRVLILPFVEQDALYEEFHLDEPWDSPHNIQLVPRMPKIYALPPRKATKMRVPEGHTVCHVFVGKNAAFEGKEGLRIRDFTDGLSNTILVIEAGEPVPWTKPEEIHYDPDEPLPALRSPFKDIIRVGMGDGSRRHIRLSLSEATLRAAITRNANDSLGKDWDE
jgi:hypothetical protein